ncbi:leucine-rich melanocyte differentiation-associated protein-like isoform X2 [Sitophilus oryzae]|uniref:Leucine-rich melanocyte differentiation-associated protein-like isoform X2 n=1 Tax=Sitophilus oryzae TaxID=7048 RepID=A0A6J2XDT7_SITOR|nr:leucine-rich melanocyte differentiation-associated protein-like isoform X2 [Sitophilus oryzae]
MIEDFPDEPQDQADHLGLFKDISEIWRDPPGEPQPDEDGDMVTRETLPNALSNIFYSEMQTPEMTNLGQILLANNIEDKLTDSTVSRLSLSHEKLEQMPKMICQEFGADIKILDLSYNNFRNVDFLEYFEELTSLILDRNPINVLETNIPFMPKLELLYLNFCKIDEIFWVESLRYNCPNLKYLSLMGNLVAPSPLNGGSIYDYLRYRLYVISILPKLIHLDDKYITDEERNESKHMFPSPFFHGMFRHTKARLPHYLRTLTEKVGDYFSGGSKVGSSKNTNLVI